MSPYSFRLPFFLNQAKRTTRKGVALGGTLLVAISAAPQQPSPTSPPVSSDNSTVATAGNTVTASVPAGTRIALVLTQPIQSRYIHRGDDIYGQTVSPVTSGNEVVIPPGTFVQGKVDKLDRQGGRAELRLQSLAITFPDGYVAPVAGPITLESDDGYAVKDPGKGRIAGAFAVPAAGLGLGALIGHSLASSQPQTITSSVPPGCTGPPPSCLSSSLTAPGSTLKDTAIGSVVGLAVGGAASLVLILGTHNFYLDAGSPVNMVLHQPIVLPDDEVADAIRDAKEHPAPEQPVTEPPQAPAPPPPNNNPGTCYTPGTPGTSGTDIPGTPGVGNSPGTPAIHIPGIPPTPPIPHPCP